MRNREDDNIISENISDQDDSKFLWTVFYLRGDRSEITYDTLSGAQSAIEACLSQDPKYHKVGKDWIVEYYFRVIAVICAEGGVTSNSFPAWEDIGKNVSLSEQNIIIEEEDDDK